MDRRRFFTAAGTTAALAGFASDRAFADDHAKPGKRFDDATVKAMRDRIRPVGADEYQARQEQARRLMKENKIDAIFVEGGTSLVYFTGLHWWLSERLFAMVMPQSGDPFFISPKFEEGRAREKLGNTVKFYTWEEHEKPIDRIRQGLQDRKLLNATLGIEETVRYYAVEQLQQQLPTLKLVSAKPVTAGCRSVKSPHEVELMQIANDITAKVYLQLQRELREGIGERELGAILSALYGEFGVEGDALVLFGEASAYPHGLTRDVKLKSGDNVLIDGGCRVEGYGSDITRTMVLGEPSAKMKQVFDIVRGAQDAALKTAKPGVPAEKVDAAARNYITEHGFGPGYKYFTHRVGHGIGMDGHEWYYLVGGNTRPLVAGNMFSNEPGIYIVGEFGIRTEDEMLITEDGARLLLPQAVSLQKIFG